MGLDLWVLPLCSGLVPNLVLGLPLKMVKYKKSLFNRSQVPSSQSCPPLFSPDAPLNTGHILSQGIYSLSAGTGPHGTECREPAGPPGSEPGWSVLGAAPFRPAASAPSLSTLWLEQSGPQAGRHRCSTNPSKCMRLF